MITKFAVSGYRSLRDLSVGLGPLNVVTGPNGSGKSSFYRALRLLADVAQGRVIESLAAEGGLTSTLWAGPETISAAVKRGDHPVQGTVRKGPVSLKLGFAADDYGYAIDLGLPPPVPPSAFDRDPEIKAEAVWTGDRLSRANLFAQRKDPAVQVRDEKGAWRVAYEHLASFDSMMTHCADPREAVELLVLRERMRDWRFYDHLRTDRDAPARRPQIGVRTPILDAEGASLAAALQTIREIGAADDMDAAVDDAFPGSSIVVQTGDAGFEAEMRQHGLLRPLKTAELSDGTLRYLMLVAALLTPRPPSLLVLNEPETSLHVDLLPALARLVVRASQDAQVVVVTHAAPLVDALCAEETAQRIELDKEFGETVVRSHDPVAWTWPSR